MREVEIKISDDIFNQRAIEELVSKVNQRLSVQKWFDHMYLRKEGVRVVDIRGNEVSRVRAVAEAPNGVHVKVLVQNLEGEYILSGVNECAEAVMFLEGGKLERKY